MEVEANLKVLQSKINEACAKANRSPNEIKVIAVTKYVSVARAVEAIEAGIEDIGENRLEGFLNKREAINKNVNWHFIGTLQSRKVKEIIENIDLIHSLDRLSLAKEINKRTEEIQPCLIQVNTSEESSKHGLSINEVIGFIKDLEPYEKIRVDGLMTMAPFTDDRDVIRECFQKLHSLRDEIKQLNLPHAPCHFLSMGMSNDYDIAIEEGATHIRVGTSLVGNEND
nr:YggS family pyridoxal phosphate-dependent enzyme [Halalkalibacillus halophilus]